jgi:hypothetical protein
MLNLSWGGYRNGYIPDSAMSPIDSQGHRLEHVAAAQFLAMQAAMLRDLGRTITVAPGADSAFRTIAQQQADYNLYMQGGNVASAPGLSNHGWGRAVDITGYEVHDDVWNWLLTHAGDYGYSHVTGAASGERWHWESTNAPSATASLNATLIAPPIEGFDMPQNWNIGGTMVTVGESFGHVWTDPGNFSYLTNMGAWGAPVAKSLTSDQLTTIIAECNARGAAYSAVGGPGVVVPTGATIDPAVIKQLLADSDAKILAAIAAAKTDVEAHIPTKLTL